MNIRKKALIYSAIVFPGAGYFILDKVTRGVAALLVTFACLTFIMVDVFHRANIIAEKIVLGDVALDILKIRQEIHLTPGIYSQQMLELLSLAIVLIWIVGIVDCYLIGSRKMQMDSQ